MGLFFFSSLCFDYNERQVRKQQTHLIPKDVGGLILCFFGGDFWIKALARFLADMFTEMSVTFFC